jgi:competence protein ComEA
VSGFLERYRWFVVTLFALPLLIGVAFLLSERLSGPQPLELDLADVPAEEIRVYVTGAVQRPGVYPLTDGDRWIDALEAAGGPTSDANLAAVDLARRARDEDTIRVPSLSGAGVAFASQAPLVDINTASAEQLATLPGIGEVRSGRIIDSRERDGPFASADELLERDLISLAVFEEIADLVTAGLPSGQAGQ